MASKQATKGERVEAAVKGAASELEDVNGERRRDEGEAKTEHEQRQHGQEPEYSGGGVLGSLLKSVQDTYGHAKEAVTGKAHKTAGKTKESGELASEKAKEAKEKASRKAAKKKDAAAEKAKEAEESAAAKAEETKERTMEKAGEYKDYTAEKAKEGKDTTVSKMAELKESAADAARKAGDLLLGNKGETKQKADETGETGKEKVHETEEPARRKMEEMKLKEDHDTITNEARKTAKGDRETAADRRSGGIFSSIGSVAGTIKDKLTHSTEDQKRASGGEHQKERFVVDMEETPAGTVVAAVSKAADQVSGQTFNDVGRMGDGGVDGSGRQGKM